MQINKLHKFYGNSFKDIFKSITFDNGNEFSRWKDMEIKPNTKEQRTKIILVDPIILVIELQMKTATLLSGILLKREQILIQSIKKQALI